MSKYISAAAQDFEQQVLEAGAPLLEKWAAVVEAEGQPEISDPAVKLAVARLAENYDVIARSGRGPVAEATQTTSGVFGSNYIKQYIGMTRKVMPRLVGLNFAAVQPLDRPSGQIFHLDITRDAIAGDPAIPEQSIYNHNQWLASQAYSTHTTGEGTAINRGMNIRITGSTVQIGDPKKLHVASSVENIQDLAAVHNLDAMSLLSNAAVDQIAIELDALMVLAARAAAIANSTVTFGPAPTGYPLDKWPHRIQRAILMADNDIYVKTGRNANVIVAGTEAALELQDLNTFVNGGFPGNGNEATVAGMSVIGQLNAQYTVIRSRYLVPNEMLVLRKGEGFLDAGLVYAPYIPLYLSPRFLNPKTQVEEQSFMSRFLIHTVSNDLFSRVVIDEDADAGINIA